MLSNKSVKSIAISTLVLSVLLTLSAVLVVPVGAESPGQLITFDPMVITYAQGNFTSAAGEWWSSEGIFEGNGAAAQSATHAGWPANGWQFKKARLITTLSDDSGTVTIKDQVTSIVWDGYDSTASGRWVIIDATGAYEGLHGVGTSQLESVFHFVCPDPNVDGVCIINEMYLNGLGHFHP